jgi:hypothetical protein
VAIGHIEMVNRDGHVVVGTVRHRLKGAHVHSAILELDEMLVVIVNTWCHVLKVTIDLVAL